MVSIPEREGSPTPQVLETVDLPESFGPKHQGKVRDWWVRDGRRVMVMTDRMSAYDRRVCLIPGKGAVLNFLTAFWCEKTRDIVPNHMIAVPHPNVMICQECTPYFIEVVVRGYITGESSTSLWRNYRDRTGVYSWLGLPLGLRKNQKLEEPVVTPTTKSFTGHDKPITPLAAAGEIGEVWWEIERRALALFERATQICQEAGLILADTKFEFGKDTQGNFVLIDEVLTPDSSRFWLGESYQERLEGGLEPKNFDKEPFRLWLKKQGFTGDGPVPKVPQEKINWVADLYGVPFKMLLGKKPPISGNGQEIRESILGHFRIDQ